jgi:hypothetical protein
MPKKRRCPHCRRLYSPDPRLKERRRTCGRQECRREQKRQSNEEWRSQHPEYFRGVYQQQKEAYGTRAEYKKQYRRQNPEYARRIRIAPPPSQYTINGNRMFTSSLSKGLRQRLLPWSPDVGNFDFAQSLVSNTHCGNRGATLRHFTPAIETQTSSLSLRA